MADDAYQAAEKRGYARGYAAGKKRRNAQIAAEERQRRREAFEQRAFLAVLPFAMSPSHNWGVTDAEGKHRPYQTVEERVDFAWRIARQATKGGPL